MKSRFILFLFFVYFLIGQTELSFAQKKQMPKFNLKNIQGKMISSQNYKGKVLLINFWATWCGPCKKEIHDLVKLKDNYGEKGFEIVSIAVSSGSPKDIGKFAKSMKMNYPVLIGDAKVVRAFGDVSMLPTTFIVDKKGQIQHMLVGAEPYKEFENKIQQFLQ